MKYMLFYDETEHSRKINYETGPILHLLMDLRSY